MGPSITHMLDVAGVSPDWDAQPMGQISRMRTLGHRLGTVNRFWSRVNDWRCHQCLNSRRECLNYASTDHREDAAAWLGQVLQ